MIIYYKRNFFKGKTKLDKVFDFTILRELRKKEGLNIADVSERSGVSSAVISKLERNGQQAAALETICRLARAFSLQTSELLSLAESRAAQKTSETSHKSGGFKFREVQYENVKCLYASAPAGALVSRPEAHKEDFELCWVLEGKLLFSLPREKHKLSSGDAIQFDALQDHQYQALEDTKLIILHIKKNKRF